MQLYSGLLSPFSAKVRIALAEKGLKYDVVEVPWTRKTLWGPKPPELLQLNPRGQVPVLVDGDVVLYDSTVIVEYLEDRYPKPPLYPADVAARARCRQLEDAGDEAMATHVTALVQELFTKHDAGARDQQRVANAITGMSQLYDRLERGMGGGDFVCGDFSVADISLFMVAGFAETLGVGVNADHPRLQAWMGCARTRPSIVNEFTKMMQAAAALT